MWAFLAYWSSEHSLTYWCYIPLQKTRKYLQNSFFLSASLNPSQVKGQVLLRSSNLRSVFLPPLLLPLNESHLQSEAWCSQIRSSPHTKAHYFIPGSVSLQQNTPSHRWDLLLAADLCGSTGSPAKASLTRHCSCSENVLVVRHIKHVHCHCCT